MLEQRRPLMGAGIALLAALVVLLSAFTLLARGTFTSNRITDTLSSGWVAFGVRAPESAGGVVTVLPVGGPELSVQPLRIAAATDALSVNDPNALSDAIGSALSRPMAGAIIFDRLAFAGLVDSVGGIRVTLDHALTVPHIDGSYDVVQAGERRLDGLAAATYVLSDPQGQRLYGAVEALLRALPRDENKLTGLVRSLGMSMRGTVSAATVVQWLEFWQSRL